MNGSSIARACLALILMLTMASVFSCSRPASVEPKVITIGGSTMGTSWSLQWVDRAHTAQRHTPDVVQSVIEAELERLNALMSTWDPESELSAFNNSQSVEPVTLHQDTLSVIDAALQISKLTNGSYDITLQPVIELWGFSGNTIESTPSDEDIALALETSGYQQLVRIGGTVKKRRPELAIDVSSLGKGYAVDKLGDIVESLDIVHYLVEIGGEVRARGKRSDNLPWRVGVESPEGEIPQVITLHNAHIASSGSYRNYRVENGKRLSHIIDGVTGRPIEHDLVSVSVVHDSTMLADAWATALLVVGEERASELIDDQALVAQLVVMRNGSFQQISTADFKALIVSE